MNVGRLSVTSERNWCTYVPEFYRDWYDSWLDSSKLGDARLGHPNLAAAEHEGHNP